ncbi:WG repeat-containing protein [Cohnella lubricantis]|uniref:WG repeat-containing protein n=1 Tax=Cohnella lubricantis TaxID=2163172 RepID=A0A841T2T8_9BACL|nr:WG repeat-containing protein [Cohnella lubricantis]MBB6675893.1 WG repeat-containing protein [Cohnella lubricantis]MBP2117190.1 hypothetical protein [Cohnella lubricantis]
MKRLVCLAIGLVLMMNAYAVSYAEEAEANHFTIEPQFSGLHGYNDLRSTFNEGLAWVQLSGDEIGVIDRSGKVLLDNLSLNHYSFTSYMFSEGLSRYRDSQGAWVYLDKNGNEVIRTTYDTVFNFREGLAAVERDGKWGYINREGKEVIKPQYDEIRDDDGYGYNAGTAGFYEGLSAVSKGGKWGFINKSGQVVVPLKYDWVNNFNEGLAVVSRNGKWGYINKFGTEVIKVIYDDAINFSEGVASVLRPNPAGNGYNWLFIDKNGTVIKDFKNKYEIVYPPEEGVAVASYYAGSPDTRYALLDRNGTLIVDLGNKYAEVDGFSEGLAWAEKPDGGVVLIDQAGQEVVEPYSQIRSSTAGLIGVQVNDRDPFGFMRNPLDVPSAWAEAEVNTAASLNLVPLEIDYGYAANITRADFSKLALNLVSVKTGKTVEELLTQSGKKIKDGVFDDTFDRTVLAANALGIISGRSTNKLDPNGLITRQEAAVMLTRVAGMLGITKGSGEAVTYTDAKAIASWAGESVAVIGSVEDKTSNTIVMGGVGSSRFAPEEPFTKQQAFITMKRLFNAV